METIQKLYRWACKKALRYVPVVGLAAYGVPLGLALAIYLAIAWRLPAEVATGIAFAFSECAGLIFGLGLWFVSGRRERKSFDG